MSLNHLAVFAFMSLNQCFVRLLEFVFVLFCFIWILCYLVFEVVISVAEQPKVRYPSIEHSNTAFLRKDKICPSGNLHERNCSTYSFFLNYTSKLINMYVCFYVILHRQEVCRPILCTQSFSYISWEAMFDTTKESDTVK